MKNLLADLTDFRRFEWLFTLKTIVSNQIDCTFSKDEICRAS